MQWIARTGLAMLFVALCAAPPMYADVVTYIFQFETQALGVPVPTGGFGYDASTGVFSDFIVRHDGVNYDYTAEANLFGGLTRIPFELGHLGSNLINGYGPLGPELSHWYGGPAGFYGFEWRTPAQDFLYHDLTIGAPSDPISNSPRAFAGTWRTTIAPPSAVPEPSTWGMLALASAAGTVALRLKRHRK